MHRQTKERKMQMNSQWKCIFEPINHLNVSSSSGHFFFFLLSLTFFSSAFISISSPFSFHFITSFPSFLHLPHYLFEAWLDHIIYIRLLRIISISSIFLSKSLFSLSKLFRFGSIHTTATSFLTLSLPFILCLRRHGSLHLMHDPLLHSTSVRPSHTMIWTWFFASIDFLL